MKDYFIEQMRELIKDMREVKDKATNKSHKKTIEFMVEYVLLDIEAVQEHSEKLHGPYHYDLELMMKDRKQAWKQIKKDIGIK